MGPTRRYFGMMRVALGALGVATTAHAGGALEHDTVDGGGIDVMDVIGPAGETESVAFSGLGTPRAPGVYTVRIATTGEEARVPHCNGRGAVTVDGVVRDKGSKGPLIVHLGGSAVHELRIDVAVSKYEKRIACGERVKIGARARARDGIVRVAFESPHKGPYGGEAVLYVPRGHDVNKPGALLVGVHPWNGTPWTYAAYRELLEEADARDVVLLMPSGLGNSLYTEAAEDEVMRAIDAASAEIAVDRQRVSIWGASMGGQGATTIGFHHPDRFASVTSFFGDAKFDVSSYVRRLLPTERAAHLVNPIDVIDNARHQPLWLIHGEADRTSPVIQSVMLDDAMKKRGFKVDFDRVPGMGHEGPLVVKFIRRVVDRAATAQAPRFPAHVTFRSTRASDTEAYGVMLVRSRDGSRDEDAYVDVEARDDGVHVRSGTSGVKEIVLRPGALGAKSGAPVIVDPGVSVSVRWGAS